MMAHSEAKVVQDGVPLNAECLGVNSILDGQRVVIIP